MYKQETIFYPDTFQIHIAKDYVDNILIEEKHFTLDHNLPGPDHWFSAEPGELKEWCHSIKTTVNMLGNSILKPTKTEEYNKKYQSFGVQT